MLRWRHCTSRDFSFGDFPSLDWLIDLMRWAAVKVTPLVGWNDDLTINETLEGVSGIATLPQLLTYLPITRLACRLARLQQANACELTSNMLAATKSLKASKLAVAGFQVVLSDRLSQTFLGSRKFHYWLGRLHTLYGIDDFRCFNELLIVKLIGIRRGRLNSHAPVMLCVLYHLHSSSHFIVCLKWILNPIDALILTHGRSFLDFFLRR